MTKYLTIELIIEEQRNKIIKDHYKKILEYLENFKKAENKLYKVEVRTKYRFIEVLKFKIINSIRNYIILGKE